MPRKPSTAKTKSTSMLRCLQPNAAGVDVGATQIFLAVPADRDLQPVRCFPTFTTDLHAAADWLQSCQIETVAMESTGVYWIPFFQVLEARGFRVFLVNARHVKNVPGRKTDVKDCQWLQYLHSVGLLRACFRPEQAVCNVRSILRHRDSLVGMASVLVQHMQKALDQMNLQLHHLISDITGLAPRSSRLSCKVNETRASWPNFATVGSRRRSKRSLRLSSATTGENIFSHFVNLERPTETTSS